MRRIHLVLGVVAVWAAVSSVRTMAMDEQRAPAPVGVPGETPKAQVEDSTGAKSDEGTEIRVPGLGKLGTLPKMDFGLELLYGAADSKPAETDPQDRNDQNDMIFHGSVRHRF